MRLITLTFSALVLTFASGCASSAPPAAVESEPAPVERPVEKTETSDATRPAKGEEIDLGLEGGSSSEIVVEEAGAGLPEESSAADSEEDDEKPTHRKCTNDPDVKSGLPKCGVDGEEIDVIEE